jgi:tripartite ATP-independent transporter DctM subunit
VTNEPRDAAAPSTRPASGAQALVRGASRWLGIAAVLAMLVIMVREIVGRTLFNLPTTWATEYSGYLVVAITFLGAAAAQLAGAHIRVTLWLDRLAPARREYVEAGIAWAALLLYNIVGWRVVEFVHREFTAGTLDWGLDSTPLWVPQSVMAVGCLGWTLALAIQAMAHGRATAGRRLAAALVIWLPVLALHASTLGWIPLKLSAAHSVWLLAGTTLLACVLCSGGRPAIRLLAVLAPPALAVAASAGASLAMKGLVLVLAMLYLMFAGLGVAHVMSLLAILGLMGWLPVPLLRVLGERSWNATNSFEMSAIPMFVLMGALLVKSEVSGEMFHAMRVLFGRVRGGLAYAAIGAAGLFAAVSGSSLATAATMGKVAGPHMQADGYDRRLAYGVLAAGGTLGIMIPPSIAMIVYGSLASVPISQLFIAGIVPGLTLIGLFALLTWLWLLRYPKDAPAGRSYTLGEKFSASKGTFPFVALMAIVLGSLYAGWATPTEAGALGALAALVLCKLRGALSRRVVVEALEEAALVTSFLLVIAAGVSQLSYVMDSQNMAASLVQSIRELNLSGALLMTIIVLFYLTLGMFVESISMVLMTLPVMLPLINAVGWDPLWFGVVLVLMVEIGLITPPVGMILFILEGVSEGKVNLRDISAGTLPFVAIMLVATALFYAVPSLVTWLPGLMVRS